MARANYPYRNYHNFELILKASHFGGALLLYLEIRKSLHAIAPKLDTVAPRQCATLRAQQCAYCPVVSAHTNRRETTVRLFGPRCEVSSEP